jgi:hypothetical protein
MNSTGVEEGSGRQEPEELAEASAARGDDSSNSEKEKVRLQEVASKHRRNCSTTPPPPQQNSSFPSLSLTDSILRSDNLPRQEDLDTTEDTQSILPRFGDVVRVSSSVLSSLNSSFMTLDDRTVEDIRNLTLVDDDTLPSRELSLSPLRPAHKNQPEHRTPVARNTSIETTETSEEPKEPRGDFGMEDHNAHHERADLCPVRPRRGTSMSSMDSERIKAAVIGTTQKQHAVHNSSHLLHNKTLSSHRQNSNSTGFPSMWEDSWTTFATLDNTSHHTTAVIMEEQAEDDEGAVDHHVCNHSPNDSLWKGPPTPPMDHPYAKKNSQFLQQQRKPELQQLLQQQQQQQQNSNMPTRSASIQSTCTPITPIRTSSRSSQYSAFSNMSSLDASVIRRISRSERINRLKRKSMQATSHSAATSMVHQTSQFSNSKSTISSVESGSYNSLSSNSKLPERRPTKLLPSDDEADEEPKSFFEHSESQLSLTSSSEEEGSDHEDGEDMTPRLPGRRRSASSLSLYEAEAAAMRLNKAHDLPLNAPIRRTSTFGSQTEIYLYAARAELESEFEEDFDDNDSQQRQKDNRPPTSIHLPPPVPGNDDDGPAEQSGTTTAAVIVATEDSVPKAPSRQRSLPRSSVQQQLEWLQLATSATTDDLPLNDNDNEQPVLEPLSDFTPSKPVRQGTLTQDNLKKALTMRRDATTGVSGEAGEEKENTSHSSLSLSSHGHRRTNSADAAPSQPTGQSSKVRPLSPAVLMLAHSTVDDSKELLRSNTGQDFGQSHVGEAVGNQDDNVVGDHLHHHQFPLLHMCPICEASSSSSALLSPQSRQGRIGSITSVSTGTITVRANNTQVETIGRRMLPCRHFTRGSSLRSAAASLQNSRNSNFSLDESILELEAKPSSEQPVSPTKEFEKLKRMNQDTMLHLSESLLDCLHSDGSASSVNTSVCDGLKPALKNAASNDSAQPIADLLMGSSNHSDGTTWTSASREFEQLKLMHDDIVADLETQLQLLEQQEHEQDEHDDLQTFENSDPDLAQPSTGNASTVRNDEPSSPSFQEQSSSSIEIAT